MANFNTHMTGAAIVSGTSATALMMIQAFPPQTLIVYFILGIVGGILPDIDSDSSIPIRWAFNVLGVAAGFFIILPMRTYYSLLELVFLWGFSFIVIRYGVFALFTKFTVHRGLIHSLPAGAFFALGTVVLTIRAFDVSSLHAWLCGIFVFVGFLTHLVLDELYSVDLRGVRLKRSFGSALSLGSLQAPLKTGALYLLTAALFYLAPPANELLDFALDSGLHQLLLERLLPVHEWFLTFH